MRKALTKISSEFEDGAMDGDDEKTIDFGSVGLYLAGLQVASTIIVCCCVSVLSCWMLPPNAISAVRTLAITTAIGLVCVRKPIRVGRVRGVSTIFNALRPAVAIYILALVIEQLVHTCVPIEEEEHTALRRALYHSMAAVMIVSAFARARSPRTETDLPFAITAVSILAIALLPPPALSRSGPLCEPASLVSAGERALRSLFFASVYCVHVYSAAPSRNVGNELFICVARASAASVWILCASYWALPLAPLQIAVVLFSRLGDGDCSNAEHREEAYASLPLNGAADAHDNHHIQMGGTLSDVEAGDVGNSKQDFAATPKLPSLTTNGARSYAPLNGSSNGLSFNFGGPSQPPAVNMAAVIARESRSEL